MILVCIFRIAYANICTELHLLINNEQIAQACHTKISLVYVGSSKPSLAMIIDWPSFIKADNAEKSAGRKSAEMLLVRIKNLPVGVRQQDIVLNTLMF